MSRALMEHGFRSDGKRPPDDEPDGAAHKPGTRSQRKLCAAALAFLIISDENAWE